MLESPSVATAQTSTAVRPVEDVAPIGRSRRLGHVPGLDGIRGIAVLMTVAAHSFFAAAPGGGVTGVAIFFVLSGFLITTVLAEEWSLRGRIDLKAFYIRRALRLLPALAVVLIVYLALAFVAFSPVTLNDRLGAAFFVATYFGNWQNATGSHLAELSHTWSVAVEDQFYFVWPVALAALLALGLRTRTVLGVALVAAAGLIILRAVAFASGMEWHRIYFGTDMVGSSLLIGCATALAFTWRVLPERPRHPGWISALACVFLGVSFLTVTQHTDVGKAWLVTLGFPGIALATAALIVAVASDPRTASWLSSPVLRYFGRISYALYLWHLLMIQVLAKVWGLDALERSLWSIPLAIILATLSYVVVEQRFLRLKDRLAPRPNRA